MSAEVSFIIPNFNNGERLRRCIPAIMNQTYDGSYDITVVDNGSTDQSLVYIKEFSGVQLLHNKTFKSPGSSRNMGISTATSPLIACIDAKCIPNSSWLETMMSTMRKGAFDIVSGVLSFEDLNHSSIYQKFDLLYSMLPPEETYKALPAGNLLIRKSVFEKIGDFKNEMRALEDIEWTHRAYTAGFKLGVSRDSVVLYPPKSKKEFIYKYKILGRGSKQIIKRSFWQSTMFRLKHIFPPSPKFYSNMRKVAKDYNVRMSSVALFFMCWYVKLLRFQGLLSRTDIER